jgi:hypothetical protein
VLLALIGRNWLHAADKDGRRRLDSPEDFVRLEIAAAVGRDIVFIPCWVQGPAMPSKQELPPDLQALAWRNALELRHTRWDADFAELAVTLQSHSGQSGVRSLSEGEATVAKGSSRAHLRTPATRCRAGLVGSARMELTCLGFCKWPMANGEDRAMKATCSL